MAESLADWIEAYRVAWETADTDKVTSLFAEESTYRSNIFEEPHRDRPGVGTYWDAVTSVQSEVTVQMGSPFVDGNRVAVEFWTNMKVEGNDVTLPGCLLLEFDDGGLCTSLREYWHFQPGVAHPPPEWGR